MSAFHVFVEGAVEQGDAALERLAEKMAVRYGLPVTELIARMKRGRFRVKANIDRATAETYVADLSKIGARAVIEARNIQGQPSLPIPILPPPTIPPPTASLAPAVPRVQTLLSKSPPPFVSGLAAAFAPPDAPKQALDLGALGGDTFSLAPLGGESEGPQIPPPPVPAVKETPSPPPSDRFTPPGGDEGELQVDIASDDLPLYSHRSAASIPPLSVPLVPPSVQPPQHVATNTAPPKRAGDARARMVIGVLLAVMIGFIPAHFVASVREKSAFAAIDARVIAAQQAGVESATLDELRATELANKRSSHRNIALGSILIWAIVGTGVGYIWFRRIPWDRR